MKVKGIIFVKSAGVKITRQSKYYLTQLTLLHTKTKPNHDDCRTLKSNDG